MFFIAEWQHVIILISFSHVYLVPRPHPHETCFFCNKSKRGPLMYYNSKNTLPLLIYTASCWIPQNSVQRSFEAAAFLAVILVLTLMSRNKCTNDLFVTKCNTKQIISTKLKTSTWRNKCLKKQSALSYSISFKFNFFHLAVHLQGFLTLITDHISMQPPYIGQEAWWEEKLWLTLWMNSSVLVWKPYTSKLHSTLL